MLSGRGYEIFGYLEGQNIAFEYRTADGVPERLAEAATDLVRRPVDIIATYGTPSSIAAKAATTTIPIVMIGVGDVVRTGLVQGLAHPGGNITGNTPLGREVQPKRLQLFKAAVPALSRVVLLWNPDNASNHRRRGTRCSGNVEHDVHTCAGAPRRRARWRPGCHDAGASRWCHGNRRC